jgi:hypothetical protein
MNWGIMGCALIAKKNIRAMKLSKNSCIKGIASSINKIIHKFRQNI